MLQKMKMEKNISDLPNDILDVDLMKNPNVNDFHF